MAGMTREEVEIALEKTLKLCLDVEETFEFTCANTNAHLANSMIEQFEEELIESRADVARLEKLLESFD